MTIKQKSILEKIVYGVAVACIVGVVSWFGNQAVSGKLFGIPSRVDTLESKCLKTSVRQYKMENRFEVHEKVQDEVIREFKDNLQDLKDGQKEIQNDIKLLLRRR